MKTPRIVKNLTLKTDEAVTIKTAEITIVIQKFDGKTRYHIFDQTGGKAAAEVTIVAPDKNDDRYCAHCNRIMRSWYDHRDDCPNA